jgi:predicted GIY-YIG superfamily endonuclease
MRSGDLLFAQAMKDHSYSVYIVASKSRVLYIAVTKDLSRRVYEHKNDLIEGFSKNTAVIVWSTKNLSMT